MSSTATSADWKTYWVNRTLPGLDDAAIFVLYAIAGASLVLGLQALLRLRQCRKDISADPSKRAATFAACDADLVHFSKRQFKLSLILSTLAGALWITDAVIGASELYDDVANKGSRYPAGFWLALAIRLVGIMAILLFTQFAAPLAQMVAFCMWMQSRREKISAATKSSTLAALIPEARTLATFIMQFWSAGFFALVAFWSPLSPHYVMRGIMLQAIAGSVNAWSHMSFVLNWRADKVQALELMDTISAREATTKCIAGAKTLYSEKADASVLPQHEQKS
ncbi:hypothetical protein Slin15195_G007740 [Septoria linicola]|uniref:Uncharacterized protein n=1 Tax=Septoria linicola TaxID=215465 RepID=A0A9Q9AJ90_9PEZI|nr:hypothetical protein Slin14017_G007750 [Septoria linicola]USW47455.1 hypothetical protein Slin15195_G007740 [Septoria linicola]